MGWRIITSFLHLFIWNKWLTFLMACTTVVVNFLFVVRFLLALETHSGGFLVFRFFFLKNLNSFLVSYSCKLFNFFDKRIWLEIKVINLFLMSQIKLRHKRRQRWLSTNVFSKYHFSLALFSNHFISYLRWLEIRIRRFWTITSVYLV
jgi:hypothetical protein